MLFAVAGLLAGTNTLADVSLYLAILGGLTAVYLSLVIRDRRRPEDGAAILGYIMYAAGFGFLSAPSRFAFGEWTVAVYGFATLCIGGLLPLTWWLFTTHLAGDATDSENPS